MKAIVIGTCGICGGQVIQPAAANFPAPPRCQRCGAQAELPVVTMQRPATKKAMRVKAGRRA